MYPLKFFFRLWLSQKIGQDCHGNTYYEQKKGLRNALPRRWVLYTHQPEARCIPPLWHGWLHSITQEAPTTSPPAYSWQKPHMPYIQKGLLASLFQVFRERNQHKSPPRAPFFSPPKETGEEKQCPQRGREHSLPYQPWKPS